jgi:hypothetical protein
MIYGYPYRRMDKARWRRCASFAPPEPGGYSREVPSGAKTDRPQLRRLLAQIGPGDVVTVTGLDRLARSTRDVSNTLAGITDKKGPASQALRISVLIEPYLVERSSGPR